jgi:hypothetical protein
LQGTCGGFPLPQAGLPLEVATTYFPVRGRGAQPVPAGGDLYMILAAPGVASVRVGDLGTIKAQSAPGLPPGDHAVVFRETAGSIGTVVPPGTSTAWTRRFLRGSPAIRLTALNSSGSTVPASRTSALLQFYSRPFGGVADHTTSAALGRCAVGEHLTGLSLESVSGFTKIIPKPSGGPGALLSCLWETYGFEGKRFQVAVLLNASHPGGRPAAIWDGVAVPGHPGIVTIHSPDGPDNGLVARRVGNAWLAAAPWVGFPGWPTLNQTLQVLSAFHIARIDLSH